MSNLIRLFMKLFVVTGLTLLLLAATCTIATAEETIQVITDNIEASTTWSAADSPYLLSGVVTVSEAATLTLEAGVVVQAGNGSALVMEGTLLASGTESQPILFGGDGNNPQPGAWKGIYFSPGSHGRMDFVRLTHAGQPDGSRPMRTGMEVASADVDIQNSTVADCLGPGLYAEAPFILANSMVTGNELHAVHFASAEAVNSGATGNEFSGNGVDAYLIEGGRLLMDWQPDSPVEIDETVTISETVGMTMTADAPLRILGGGALSVNGNMAAMAGSQISAEGSAAIRVYGSLRAIGSEDSRVVFGPAGDTSTLDDWRGLYFYAGSVGELQHVVIEHAGRGDGLTPLHTGLEIASDDVFMNYLTVRNTRGYGIYATADITMTNSTITHNERGVVVANDASVSISESSIVANDIIGVENRTPVTPVQAMQNWWGAASGPFHPELNPDGEGDVVSSGVLFTPWIEDLDPDEPELIVPRQFMPMLFEPAGD